jgi:ribosomal RNA-processing protein 8
MRLFTNSPQAYTSYHAGFRAQVAVWPQNPVEGFIEDVKTRGSLLVPSQKKMWREQKKGKKGREQPIEVPATSGDAVGEVKPLPRTKGTCTIADLGCGDAHLATSLDPLRKSLNLNLLSFDLAKGDTPNAHLITVADTSDLSAVGVRDGSVDIAICCLSLMGTNWVSVVDECSRIVRGGGEVWVAEIKSRFARPGQTKKRTGDGKMGDGIGKQKKKKQTEADDADNEEPAAIEETSDSKAPKDETDISSFVEVFRKRGFNLKDEPDMDNKMFVRMRFVKALRSENEKGGAARFGDGFRGKQAKTKVLEDEGEVDESKVLKPCVYKVR